MTYDAAVVVIGAGPAGLTLANLLQSRGVSVAVVEKFERENLLKRARAGILEHRTVELMSSMGLGDRLLEEGREHSRTEFRSNGSSFCLDIPIHYGGLTHRIYPQQQVVRDLLEGYERAGGSVIFGCEAVEISHDEHTSTVVLDDGATIRARVVAAADGTYGIGRRSIPEGAVTEFEMEYEFRWLTLLAETGPSAEWTIYGHHETGFAGHLLRTDRVTRFHLQVGMDDTVEEWTDERIWAALRTRLGKPGWTLKEGPIISRNMLDMRSRVSDPMVVGRTCLLGDAAHIITPAGGKGMNLAMADAADLAGAIVAFVDSGEEQDLLAYSDRRLPDIWRAQEFSNGLLHMIHQYADGSPDAAFKQKLQQSRLWQLENSEPFVRSFAASFVGPLLGEEIATRAGVDHVREMHEPAMTTTTKQL